MKIFKGSQVYSPGRRGYILLQNDTAINYEAEGMEIFSILAEAV